MMTKIARFSADESVPDLKPNPRADCVFGLRPQHPKLIEVRLELNDYTIYREAQSTIDVNQVYPVRGKMPRLRGKRMT